MQPSSKRIKTENTTINSDDPFDEEEDWDNDDSILQLVANEAPTYSQVSQAIKAPSVVKQTNHNDSSTGKPRTFMFKRPSSTASSVLSTKPTSYGASAVYKPAIADQSMINNVAELSANETLLNGSAVTQGNGAAADDHVDVSTLKKQVSDLIRKQHAHEGEIKWLRSTLKEKDGQINTVRTNLNAESAKLKLQNSEKERAFIRDIEQLRSELQFKESELMSVNQSLDKLKRDQSKPKPPTMRLDNDGFPVNTEQFGGSPKKKQIPAVKTAPSLISSQKSEPMDTSTAETPASTSQLLANTSDLRPQAVNRLTPRTHTAAEHKRRILLSTMLKNNLENVKHNLSSLADGSNSDDKLINDAIVCAKQLKFL